LRILHSSDWHIGQQFGPASLGRDHDLFFDWLIGELRSRAVDVLVVAGDVFDHVQPSAEAQTRYYRLLARLADTGISQVVIVGGNHDSAARLDAPAEVLAALRVHVVGGLDLDRLERSVIPLMGRSGTWEAVALAVPYVHEYRLGIRTTDLEGQGIVVALTERLTRLYRDLADIAAAQYPGLPLIATGHFALGSARSEDSPVAIHHAVGSLEVLPETIIDPRIQYLALGHIHRSYPLAGGRAWYSGTPLAFSLPETRQPRRVLQVELDPSPGRLPVVVPIEVPRFRSLLEREGSLDELVAWIQGLRWEEPLPPILSCKVLFHGGGDQTMRLQGALERHPEGRRPIIGALQTLSIAPIGPGEPGEAPPLPALADLSPVEVLRTLCERRQVPLSEGIEAAFRSLVEADPETWSAQLGSARGESPATALPSSESTTVSRRRKGGV
jgi:exonuclease SbcD